jgi:hypothetical protein
MTLDFVNPKQSKSYIGVSFLAGAGAEWFILITYLLQSRSRIET